ncbi:hypothetical protein, partial [Escherichia coli]|uniref:hypothetical protein n=1 Tax=Escherichia coli TaxID=562 RepID=UPI001BCE7ED0
AVCSPSFLMNPIRFFSHSMLLMRMFVVLPGVFLRCFVVVQYIACGRWVQGGIFRANSKN